MAGRVVVFGGDADARAFVTAALAEDFFIATHIRRAEALVLGISQIQPEFALILDSNDNGAAISLAARVRVAPECNGIPVAAVVPDPSVSDYSAALSASLDDVIDLSAPLPLWRSRIAILQAERTAMRDLQWRDALQTSSADAATLWDEPLHLTITALVDDLIVTQVKDVNVVPQDGASMASFLARLGQLHAAADATAYGFIAVVDDASDVDVKRSVDAGAADVVAAPRATIELPFRRVLLMRRHAYRGAIRQQVQLRLREAFLDPLTGLANRRALFRHSREMIDQKHLHDTKLSVAMLDLDFFKRINDAYGHNAGDEVLCRLAARLRLSVRRTDVVGRLGGEEFLVLMPGAGINKARRIATRILDNLCQGLHLPCAPDREIVVTASIGLVEVSKHDSPEDVFADADTALSCAKKNGRNNVQLISNAA